MINKHEIDPARTPPFLVVERVSAGYGSDPFVVDVSIGVGRGEVVLIIGPNGSGKSTLLKAVIGELRLMGGTVLLDGQDLSRTSEDQRAAAGIGYVPQTRDVFPTLLVEENLEMGGYRLPRRDVATQQEHVYGVFPALFPLRKRLARTLSGGERKMLGIGRALMCDPPLLILDEPTSNLSPRLAEEFLSTHVRSLAAQGRAVLLVEQRVDLAVEVASWVYVLGGGRSQYSGSASYLDAVEDIGSFLLGTSTGDDASTASGGGGPLVR